MSDSSAKVRHWWQAVRRFFWLGERMATAKKDVYGPGSPGFEDFRFGRALLDDADRLGEYEEGRASSLALLRAAAGSMIRAELARLGNNPGVAASKQECWARLQGHPSGPAAAKNLTDEERALVGSALGGDSVLARLPSREIASVTRVLTKVGRGLAAPMVREAGRTRRVWWLRGLRLGPVALVIGLALWLLARETDPAVFGSNLALNRPVTVSPQHPDYARDPRALVDGDRNNLGFHTNSGPNQQVTIDLGSVVRISRVVVYNRTDCCFDRSVPLLLEVSADGKSYERVAERREVFDQWSVKVPGAKARYVRLTDLKNDYFHLAEVEVY